MEGTSPIGTTTTSPVQDTAVLAEVEVTLWRCPQPTTTGCIFKFPRGTNVYKLNRPMQIAAVP